LTGPDPEVDAPALARVRATYRQEGRRLVRVRGRLGQPYLLVGRVHLRGGAEPAQQFRAGEPGRRAGPGDPAVAQDDDPVHDAHDLVELVADVDDQHALALAAPEVGVQLFGAR